MSTYDMTRAAEQSASVAGGGLLFYPADRRSVLMLVVCLTLLLLPLYLSPSGALMFAWMAVNGLLCFCACVINHNHVHHATFRSPLINELFSHLLGMAKGHTSCSVIVAHNYNHHAYHGGMRDWSRPQLAGDGFGLLRLFRYLPAAARSMAKGKRAPNAPGLPMGLRRRQTRERLSLLTFTALVLVLGGWQALWFVFIPWLAGIAMLLGANFLQHDGCEAHSEWAHSRNFTGRVGNLLLFNNGYHTAHHLHPGMHWSLLADFHQDRLAARIPARLNRRSLLGFVLRYYVLARGAPDCVES